jgi:excinuclease UvrABC helicase subunit UvrB
MLRGVKTQPQEVRERPQPQSKEEIVDLIRDLEDKMHTAADRLEFELAASLRDEIRKLKKDI